MLKLLISIIFLASICFGQTYIKGPALIEGTTSGTSNVTLDSSSQTIQRFTSGTLTIKLPDATTVPLGRKFYVFNDTGSLMVLQNFGGLSGRIIPDTKSVMAVSYSAASANGDWHITDLVTTLSDSNQVTGVLPVANGGTNSGASLNSDRVMISSGSSIIEAPAITGNKSVVSDASGIPVASITTDTEISYVNGVTSNIQTQLDSKQGPITVREITGNDTLTTSDKYVIVNTAVPVNITLADATGVDGIEVSVKCIGGGEVTLIGTVDNGANPVLNPGGIVGTAVTLVSYSGDYYVY